MKKITLLILLVINIINANAQDKGDIEFGGNIGLNLSNVVAVFDGETIQTQSRVSFNLGATGEYYFSDRWGLKAKVIYDRKGWNEDLGDEIFDGLYVLDYISIPVMANWHFGKERNWYLNFGFYTAFLSKAEFISDDFTVSNKDLYNTNDFGLALGIGVKFPINDRTKFFIEYDAQSGFSDVFEDSNFTSRNGRSAFNVGVLFDL